MKKLFLILLVLVPAALWAHTPLLVVEDNGDGTIYIEAGFSNGASAAGTDIIIKLKASGEIFWQGKMGEDYIEHEMPSEPYTVTLDAGPGHVVTKDGPEPVDGFGAAAAAVEAPAKAEVPAKGEAPASEKTAAAAPVSSGEVTWSPAMTMGAVPPTPTRTIEIIFAILGILQLGVLVYIAILVKRARK